jgi:hypothetical protein
MKKLLTILFLFAWSAQATTYYVRTDGSNSASGLNNTNNPTTGAWLTLSYACAHTTSGDLISVQAGTFTETNQCVLPVGVSIEGVDSSTAIIKSTATSDFIAIIVANSLTQGTNGNQHISGLKFDGQVSGISGGTAWCIEERARSNFSVYGCSFKDFRMSAVIMTGNQDNSGNEPTTYATGNSFYNNRVYNCSEYNHGFNSGQGQLMMGGQIGMLVYGNTMVQNQRTAGYNGWPIKYYENGYLKGCKIYNNYLQKAPLTSTIGDYNWDFAIEFFRETGLEIYNNEIVDGGVDVNYQIKDAAYSFAARISNNLIYNISPTSQLEAGITVEFGSNTVNIDSNTIYNKAKGIIFTPRSGDTVKLVKIRKNLMYNIGVPAQNGFLIDFVNNGGITLYFDSNYVYNNTMLIYPTNPNYFGIQLPAIGAGYIKHFFINNNIIQNAQSYGIYQANASVVIDSSNISYNSLYGNGNSNTIAYLGSAPTHSTTTGNFTFDPQLTSSLDTLSVGSPARDAGINVGLSFRGTAPDLGYYELVSPASLPQHTFQIKGRKINFITY